MPPIRNNNFVNNLNNESVEVDALRVFLITAAVISTILAVLFFSAGKFFEYNTQKSLAEITSIDQKLDTLPLTDMSVLSARITTVDGTQRDKNNLTTLLAVLSDSIERYTYFTDMNFSDRSGKGGFVNIKGIAQSYEDIIKQVDRLKSDKYKPFVKSVVLSDLSSAEKDGSESIKFSLDLEIESKVKSLAFDISEKSYDASKKPIKVILNNDTNLATTTPVTDSSTATSSQNIASTTAVINKKP